LAVGCDTDKKVGTSKGDDGGWLDAADEEYMEGSAPISERGEYVLALSDKIE
jgi:hypothetical protein